MTTDDKGKAYFIPGESGEYTVYAEASGYYDDEEDFTVGEAESCDDGILNQDETDIDCGGNICNACGEEGSCSVDADCESGWCLEGVCTMSTCSDGVLGPGEDEVDCGGPCPACETCSDGLCNQNESDTDCGGVCGGCGVGGSCNIDPDCISGWCHEGLCDTPSCTDGILNSDETGIDCGGSCDSCRLDESCVVGSDCLSGWCHNG